VDKKKTRRKNRTSQESEEFEIDKTQKRLIDVRNSPFESIEVDIKVTEPSATLD